MNYHCRCVFSVLLTMVQWAFPQQPCRSFETATENLREVVIGSCTIYQQNVNQPVFCSEGFRNCTEIWKAFSGAFLFQPKCNVSDERLDEFIRLTDHSIPKDKSLFWENVYPFVIRYTNRGQRYYALSDTLPGYIGNGPQWCSDSDEPTGLSPPGSICPGWDVSPDCPQSAQRAFWIAASKNFGRRAKGEISILFNATFDPIFGNDTYLAVYELPYLQKQFVTKAIVLLINEKPVQGQTKCDDPTLNLIIEKMEEKGIKYECIENRKDVVETFCLDYPTSAMCNLSEQTSSSSTRTFASSTLALTFISLAVLMLF